MTMNVCAINWVQALSSNGRESKDRHLDRVLPLSRSHLYVLIISTAFLFLLLLFCFTFQWQRTGDWGSSRDKTLHIVVNIAFSQSELLRSNHQPFSYESPHRSGTSVRVAREDRQRERERERGVRLLGWLRKQECISEFDREREGRVGSCWSSKVE